MAYRQRTLKTPVECTGIGLHTGHKVNLIIKPAPPDSGIIFIRNDLPGRPSIKAVYGNVINTHMSTTIGYNGYSISTVEHLMAAFFGLGIDNALVELDGPEVPAMDGSSAPFVFLMRNAGIVEQRSPKKFLLIKKGLKREDGNKSIEVRPSNELRISYVIDFSHPLINSQQYEISFSEACFYEEISKARTFGFLKDVQMLRKMGLARGGSLDNAIVVDDFRILNEDGLRYEDEFVRHKILDFIGDLSLLPYTPIGHFIIIKSGHFLNHLMLKELMKKRRCWKLISFKDEDMAVNESNIRVPVLGKLEPSPA